MNISIIELAVAATTLLAGSTYLAFRHWSPPRGMRWWTGPGVERLAGLAYGLAPADAVQVDELDLPDFVSLESCEFFASGGRERVVVTLNLRSNMQSVQDIAGTLENASLRVLEASGADIVVIELAEQAHTPSDTANWVAVRSADKKGWHGVLPVGSFFIEGPRHLNLEGRRWEG